MLKMTENQLLQLYPWIYIQHQTSRSVSAKEIAVMDGILPYLSVTPHYYITNHFDSFVSFIVLSDLFIYI